MMSVPLTPALLLCFVSCAIQKIEVIASQDLCSGPIEIAQVSNIETWPNADGARKIQLTFKSSYQLAAYLTIDGVYLVNSDDSDVSINYENRRGGKYVITITSPRPLNASKLSMSLQAQHPCNNVVAWMNFPTLMVLYQEGIPLPVVSDIPRKGYRIADRPATLHLKFGITYAANRFTSRPFGHFGDTFRPQYLWTDSNILFRGFDDQMASKVPRGQQPNVTTQNHNFTRNGFTTVSMEVNARFGYSIPLEGSVMQAMRMVEVNRSNPEPTTTELGVYVFTYSSIEFRSEQTVLPMGVDPLDWMHPQTVLAQEEVAGVTMLTIGLDQRTPKGKRGFSCVAAGFDTAPLVAVAYIQRPDSKGEITGVKPVDTLFPGAVLGPVGYGEFKVGDLPLGGEAYYMCSASTGGEVSSIIIKVIGFTPLEAKIDSRSSNSTVGRRNAA